MKFIASFSGGKDSMLALHRMIKAGHTCCGLITTNDKGTSSWIHDINLNILEEIASSLNMLFYPMAVNQENYAADFKEALLKLKETVVVYEAIVFGDIDILEHREWCENLCNEVNVKAVFPLWQEDREKLVLEFLNAGYQAVIKKVMKDKLTKDFLGKPLNIGLVEEFKQCEIDVCGENGEYHTLVYDGPLFTKRINLSYQKISESEYAYGIEAVLV